MSGWCQVVTMLFGYIPKYYVSEVRILTQKQILFCKWYASTQNATKSAIKAGYSEKSAYSQGHRLLKNVEIQNFIKEEVQKIAEDIPENDEILQFWADIMRDSSAKMPYRITASNNLAKAKGMYRDDW